MPLVYGTPDMRVCEVTEEEDFTVRVVTDPALASLNVEVVACGELADARVRVVTEDEDAVEFVRVIEGSFS